MITAQFNTFQLSPEETVW